MGLHLGCKVLQHPILADAVLLAELQQGQDVHPSVADVQLPFCSLDLRGRKKGKEGRGLPSSKTRFPLGCRTVRFGA